MRLIGNLPKTLRRVTYIVRGSGDFPQSMLGVDRCYAVTEKDQMSILGFSIGVDCRNHRLRSTALEGSPA